jgi:hypothetical protein
MKTPTFLYLLITSIASARGSTIANEQLSKDKNKIIDPLCMVGTELGENISLWVYFHFIHT